MSFAVKWWARLSAVLTGGVLTLVVPAHAWAASNGADGLVIEAVKARRRSGFGFLPILGGVCCLVVVGGIILALVLISRNRKRR
ncbi:hypothetical protein AB0M36_09450 [Actinoplanes sp. NPDC051346]|uniref:hypothetical protein n=1 Tax=Actinoplanes sp. NPDC051346 TaxID=3155048 RepID=UPI003436492C